MWLREDFEPSTATWELPRVHLQRETQVSREVNLRSSPVPGLSSASIPVVALPKAELQPVLDRAGVLPRWGWGNLGLRRWGLLLGDSNGEGELRGLRLPEAGQKVRGDVLGPGAGAAAPLGFAPLVEGHVPLAPRARAAMHGRGVGVVAVLLEALPKMAVHREAGLQGQRGHRSQKPGGTCPPSPVLACLAVSQNQALRSGWKHEAPTLKGPST